MSDESQAMSAGDGAEAQSQEERPWLKMGDEEIHVLSPLYRLRSSKHDYVYVWGMQTFFRDKIHRAAGIVAALCNGKRTIADIARITRPLVQASDDREAMEVAKERVKKIIHTLSQTREELAGEPRKRNVYPPSTVLVTKEEYDRKFGGTKFLPVEYHAKDFLPKDASEMRPEPNRNRREAAPLQMTWNVTSECSTDCRYCYLGRRKVKRLSKERMLSLMEEAATIKVMEIIPTGGDLLLYQYLEDILDAMRKYRFLPVDLATKSFLSREKAEVLAGAASVVLGLQFSIDSTVSDVADYLVRAKGYCDRVFKSIDNALETGLHVDAKAVITPYNILTIPKLYRDLKKRGVSTIRLAAYSRSGFHHSDDLFNHVVSYQWLEEQIKQLQQEFPDDDIRIQNGPPVLKPASLEDRLKAWPKRAMCSAGRSTMVMCTDGKVIPCEQTPETEKYFCGDLSYQSIQEVWDSDRLRELTYGIPREKFKGQPCYDCEEWRECIWQKGNCVRDLAKYEDNIYQPPPNCPKYNKSFIRTV